MDKHGIDRRTSHKDLCLETVTELYAKGLSMASLGHTFDVSETTIGRFMDQHHLKRRPANGQRTKGTTRLYEQFSVEAVAALYHEQNRTIAEVANELDVSASTMYRFMKRNSIPRRPTGRTSEQHADPTP